MLIVSVCVCACIYVKEKNHHNRVFELRKVVSADEEETC